MEALEVTDGARAWLVRRAQELVVPLGIHLDVTYRCDLDCVHCYLTDRQRDELTLEEYEALFDELRALGTLFLLVSGGEIFHRPDGLDILKAAAKRRFELRIITHGGHIDAELAAELAAIGVRVVAMSIYATDAETHDAITKVPGSWQRTVDAARNLRAVGVPVMFKCVLMDGNRGVVDAMQKLAHDLNCGIEFSINVKGDNEGGDALMDLNVDLDERVAVFDCVYPNLVSADALPAFSPDEHTCLAGNASCYIAPNGDVQPCLEWDERAGNIRDAGFTDVWKNAPVFRAARTIRRGSFTGCSSCDNFSHCSLCPAKAQRETGSTTGSAPSKCRETTAVAIGFAERGG